MAKLDDLLAKTAARIRRVGDPTQEPVEADGGAPSGGRATQPQDRHVFPVPGDRRRRNARAVLRLTFTAICGRRRESHQRRRA